MMPTDTTLKTLVDCLGLSPQGLTTSQLSTPVKDLCMDSREVKPGDVFVALSGFKVHGLDYAYQAERSGAIAVITEPAKADRAAAAERRGDLSIPVLSHADLSGELGVLASTFYGHPSQSLKITAVTGTNGKTSVAWLLMHALQQLGTKTGYMGTLGIGGVDSLKTAANTTPSAIDIQKNLAAMRSAGYQHVCIEVSSHGLDQSRFKGTAVDAAVFTNLSRDHLDYHKTMQAYADAKKRLFTDFDANICVINADDECGRKWIASDQLDGEVQTYATGRAADYQAENIKLLSAGIAFDLLHQGQRLCFETALLGQFNVQNILSVLAVLNHQGYQPVELKPVIEKLQPVPGRMNRMDDDSSGAILVVDYAHTPDALEQVLQALREHTENELWCVFGCGGNRDKGKRAMMGAVAEKLADKVVLTDDNPRFESSAQIISDIEFGMRSKPHVINNRKQAIAHVLDKCQQGDIILVAGKGHESTQEVNGELYPFNDMAVARELMQVAS